MATATRLSRRALTTSSSSAAAASSSSSAKSSISQDEIAHFSALARHWWNPQGEFGMLHRMNPARVQFLRESLLRYDELRGGSRWLSEKKVLDVGCGGGIFAESLARLGAKTLGLDASAANIAIARDHASQDPRLSTNSLLEYRCAPAEELVHEHEGTFDVVCAMEVLEHVDNPRDFLASLCRLTKPGGLLLLSTISRTPLARFLTLTMAEDVMRVVTPGTHTYSKYVKPAELAAYFADEQAWYNMETRGCVYNPLSGNWSLLSSGQFAGLGELANYFAGVQRPPVLQS